MTAFKAAVLNESESPLSIERVSIRGLSDMDVVVVIKATSLCHTDLEAVQGHLGVPVPLIPGHEAAGIVEWTGKSVRQVAKGDHVVISWNPHCNICFYCKKQQPILCQQYRNHASTSMHFDGKPRVFMEGQPIHQLMYAGTFAEMAVVTESCAVKIPKTIPLDLACLIGCGVMTGVGAAIKIAKVEPGSSATVIGCGAVGLSAIQGARLAKAETIIAVDRDPEKLETAIRFGATHALRAGPDLTKEHAELTAGRGADYVFEAAGNEAAFRATMVEASRGGSTTRLPEGEASGRAAAAVASTCH